MQHLPLVMDQWTDKLPPELRESLRMFVGGNSIHQVSDQLGRWVQALPHQVREVLPFAATHADYGLHHHYHHHAPLMIDQWGTWLSDPAILGALLWTGLVSTALALYLETVALKVMSASELTLIMTSVSLWGAAFAYFTLGETLSHVGMVGGALIVAGCAYGSIGGDGGGDDDPDNVEGVVE